MARALGVAGSSRELHGPEHIGVRAVFERVSENQHIRAVAGGSSRAWINSPWPWSAPRCHVTCPRSRELSASTSEPKAQPVLTVSFVVR